MIIRLGDETVRSDNLKAIEARTESYILEQITKGVRNDLDAEAKGQISRTMKAMREDIHHELSQMGRVLLKKLDHVQRGKDAGLSASDLLGGTSLNYSFQTLGTGKIHWPGISLKYANYKYKYYRSNQHKFFRQKNNLKRVIKQFADRNGAAQSSFFGGFKVDKVALSQKESFTKLSPRKYLAASVLRLGEIRVTIFPKANSLIMPGFSSGVWTDVNMSGAVEQQAFKRHAHKLIGRKYRPLIAPTAQFFALIRIPNALAKYVRRANAAQRKK